MSQRMTDEILGYDEAYCSTGNHDKCYSSIATVLSSLPPVSLCNWICRRCGATGTDRQEIKQDSEYEQLKRRFAKKEQK
jgi:hypothetical protein